MATIGAVGLQLAVYSLIAGIAIIFCLIAVRAWTTLSYYYALRQFNSSTEQSIVKPPQIPYWIPWLGNTLAFLGTTPGTYWEYILSWHPRSTGVFTLLIGGRRSHILYSPTAVQALFKARSPARDVFENDLYAKVYDMSLEQAHNAHAGKPLEVELNSKYLLDFRRVNELTECFTQALDKELTKSTNASIDRIGLYAWLRGPMFAASVTALMGEKLLEMYPNYGEDVFAFDADLLSFFFGLPNFIMREAIARRGRIVATLMTWAADMTRLSGGAPLDPEGPAWEPLFGSRLNRARQLFYKESGLNARSGAGFDLGMTFGLSSNAIPATGWMLMNILQPDADPRLLGRVLNEIRACTRTDNGSLDIAALMQMPLLNSIWTETLRLYLDVLVARNLPEDLTLPVDEDQRRQVQFKKGDFVFAPALIGHNDPVAWAASNDVPSPNVFYADRFVVKDRKTGQESFKMGRTAGKFFPFGGGGTLCPGRHFAKQEALSALAIVLMKVEFEPLGYLSAEKKATKDFPRPASAFPGSGILAPGGDILVKIRQRF